MDREQALAKANEIVAGWLDPPTNQRGYPVDGWKPTSPTERADIVVKLAEFLWEPEPEPDQPPNITTLYGWPIDGSGGKPSRMQYDVAKGVLTGMVSTNRPVRADELNALHALIAAYEQPEGS